MQRLNNTMELYLGDCLEEMKKIPDGSVDLVLTDPPYELGFMGKSWDSTGIANNIDVWKQCLRVLKPGGHILSFGGTRTYHRMASAIEDAGFEVRDMIEWVYGSGFPKSLNIGKSIESKMLTGNASKNGFHKLDGEKREGRIGMYDTVEEQGFRKVNPDQLGAFDLEPTTDEAKLWNGWGTALKPAHEPICMARKPLAEKTVAENCLKWGTGGINIDESRVAANWKEERPESWFNSGKSKSGNPTYDGNLKSLTESTVGERLNDAGRFPANLIHDNSEEVRECFPNESERFFKSIIYQAKASKSDRNGGCEDIEEKQTTGGGGLTADFREDGSLETSSAGGKYGSIKAKQSNNHPTVKPTKLMEYLITMTSRDGATILDPFMGSGTTGVACKRLNRNFIGIEMDETYFNIAKERINNA